MKRITIILLSFVLVLNFLQFGFVDAEKSENEIETTNYFENILSNGSFENDLLFWKSKIETPTVSDIVYDGTKSVMLSNKYNAVLYSDVSVLCNTQYSVSFYYKGTATDNSIFGVRNADGMESALIDDSIIYSGKFVTSKEWKKVAFSFNSGEHSLIRLCFIGGEGSSLLIDNVALMPSNEENILRNGSLEEEFADDWEFELGKNNPRSKETVGVYSGNYSLNLANCWKYMKIRQRFRVDENSEYILRYRVKTTTDTDPYVSCRIAPDIAGQNGPYSGYVPITNAEWLLVEKKFNSGSNEQLYITFNSATDKPQVYIDDISIIKLCSESAIIKNGSFENGIDNWNITKWQKFDLSDESYNGNYSLDYGSNAEDYAGIYQDFYVSKDTDYIVSFSIKGKANLWNWGVNPASMSKEPSSTDGLIFERYESINHENWTRLSAKFHSGQNEQLRFTMRIATDDVRQLLIDDVKVEKSNDETSVVKNASFENGLNDWKCSTNYLPNIDSTNSYGGCNSLNVVKGGESYIYQEISVPSRKKCKVSYAYKGSVPDDFAVCSVRANEISGSDSIIISESYPGKSDEWKDIEFTFESADHKNIYIVLNANVKAEYSVDLVSVNEALQFGKMRYICSEKNNLINDFGFEIGNGQWNTETFINSNLYVTEKNTEIHSGQKGLKLSCRNLSKNINMNFNVSVEKNKNYIFSVWLKGEYYSKSNTNDAHITLTSKSGKILASVAPASWDNEWHLLSVMFNTRGINSVDLNVAAANSTMYIDDIYLFDESNKIESKGAALSKRASLTAYSPENNGCADTDNLIENYDLSLTVEQNDFWQTGTVYGRRVNIKNTGYGYHGKALHYKETDDLFYGKKTYYFKWIDVKPDTSYTFSADLLIMHSNQNGCFKLVDGNSYLPTDIAVFNYSEENFKSDYTWQNVSCVFETNDCKRVGIAIFDGGGEAYIDNLRLCETSKSVKTETVKDKFPETLTSDLYSVSNEYVSGIKGATDIHTFLCNMNIGDNITVYDDKGNSITDVNQHIKTGMRAKLRCGEKTIDEATLVVDGDANDDSFVDIRDLVYLKKATANNAGVSLSSNGLLAIGCSDNSKINAKYLIKLKQLLLA